MTLAVAALAAMTQMQTAEAATVSSPFGGIYVWSIGDLSVTSTISGGGSAWQPSPSVPSAR